MKQLINQENFDVVVIYSGNIAYSAMQKDADAPFHPKGRQAIYNDSYRYFLFSCKKWGLKAAFATSEDIIGAGRFKSFWTYNKGWIKNYGEAKTKILFFKFTPRNQRQKNQLKLLASSKSIYFFNSPKLKNIFQNKLNTYKYFKEFTIPTIETKSLSKKTILSAKQQLDTLLEKRKYADDFNDYYIIKDKTGAGGFRIFKVNFAKAKSVDFDAILKQYGLDKQKPQDACYIIQPFIDCSRGFVFGQYKGMIDLRVIVLNKKIVQTYIRIAKKGNFRSNEHQGGNLVYLPLNVLPKDVLLMTRKIIARLNKKLSLNHAVYSLDFIRSNQGHLYFIEGNDAPGIDWNHKKRLNEKKSKELIDLIVKELAIIKKEKKIK